jgi:hypothetical protein
MPETTRPPEGASGDVPTVTVCEICPGRSLFAQDGNTDAWIATDLTVDIDR